MTCDQSELRMAELLAGEIAPGDRAELDRHLLDCESCREDFEFARAGYRVEWADAPVPPALVEATLASIKEAPPVVRFFRWATAAAALLGVGVLLVTSSRSRPPATPLTTAVRAAACTTERPTVLATMQEPGLGLLACQDDAGRPVGDLSLRSHDVSVEILDGIAKTTVEENFENHTDRRLEGTFLFPLPSDASISRLALEVNGKIEEGTCLERERARQVFESIVRRMQDPALLEWQPGGLFKCRIFPIEPRATKRVIVAYTQTLPCFQGKMRYVYPLASEKTRTHPPGEVRINVLARFTGDLSKMESTSHHLDVQRKNKHEGSMSFRATNYRPNNDFVVTLEPTEDEVRVVCHKPEGEDGYFACFATPRATQARTPQKYTFVLDASASISAPRLEVAKRLVRAMMERKIDGDRFEVLAHSIETRSSGEVDLRAANTFMDELRPIGGSDVLKALQAAGPGEIIYIGKGQPTFGETETAAILDAVKGLRIRTIAVGSDANLPLLERLGGLMRITPNDEVDKRVGEIAATLGSPVVSELKVEGDILSDINSARDVFAGERMVAVGRYKGVGTWKVVISGRGYRREVDVTFPDKEDANNPVRRLWAQRKVADLIAQGESKKAEITSLGVKYQIMTPYTSFLVLESEQMWKDHQLQREVQKQDQVLGKKLEEEKKRMAEAESAAQEIGTKREVTRRMADLLSQIYAAYEGQRYDRAIELSDVLLQIDPRYTVAKELRDGAERARHVTRYSADPIIAKIQEWKRVTESGAETVIPWSQTVRFPSREEWEQQQSTVTRALAQGRSADEQQRIDESQQHYEQALMFNNIGDLDKAKAEAQKSVEAWHENTAARKLLNDVHRMTVGGRPGDASDDFRVKVKQAQIEITKHVRDGERYLNARMYYQATKEFENAEFKIQNMPYDVSGISDLLPLVREASVRSRNSEILEGRRTEEEKRRFAEAEAAASPVAKPAISGEWDDLLNKLESAYTVQEQEKMNQADKLYQSAERYYTAGDFEKSEIETQKALHLAPNHAPSRALQTETQFILGKGKATPSTGEYDSFMKEALVRHQQVLVEVDNAMERGRRLQAAGDLTNANREYRKVLEYAKWMPTGVELEVRRKQALDLAGQTGGPGFSSRETTRLEPWDARLQPFTTNGTAPGAPITDAFAIDLVTDGVQLDTGTFRVEADLQALARQSEVQLAQIQELTTKVDEHRAKLAKTLNGKSLATGELQDARQLAERLQEDLSALEEKHIEMARDGKRLEEKVNVIAQGGNVNVAPKKLLEGKVTAVADQIGLVVISLGKDDGVLEGDEFSIYRGGELVAKIVIDRADRKWAAGKVVLKKSDPKVADDVSNAKPMAPRKTISSEERLDLQSAANLELIRFKMGLKE